MCGRAQTGRNIRRFARYEGTVASYIHGGGRIGVLVKFDTDCADKPGFDEFAKNIAMQIAAAGAEYLDRDSVPADRVEHEKEILAAGNSIGVVVLGEITEQNGYSGEGESNAVNYRSEVPGEKTER